MVRNVITLTAVRDVARRAPWRVMCLVWLGILAWVMGQDPMMINNGDYHRVLIQLFQIPQGEAPPDLFCPRLESSRFSSTMGLVVRVAAPLSTWFPSGCMPVKMYAAVLFVMLAAGVSMAIWRDKSNVVPALVLIGLAIFLSPLLSSFYEEAVVLPVVAWLLFGYTQLIRLGKPLAYVLAATALVYAKAQMAIFMPLLVGLLLWSKPLRPVPRWQRVMGCVLICAGVIGAGVSKSSGVHFNAYNRIYNGIGWSVLNVSAWPAFEFNQRRDFFYKHRAKLVIPDGVRLHDGLGLIGTSYWPTGQEIMSKEEGVALKSAIQTRSFLQFMSLERVWRSYIASVYAVTLTSDYGLHYLSGCGQSGCVSDLYRAKSAVLRYFGYLYLLLACVCVAMTTGIRRGWSFLYLALMPMAVVVGDGFFEFEKHLLPYAMTLPIFVCLIRPPRYADA